MTTPYRPTSFTSELVSRDKLEQMANNDQWLFENTPRLRYTSSGLTRDTGLKLLAGKFAHAPRPDANWLYSYIYFGSFFSVNCKPIVTIGYEGPNGHLHRNHVVMVPLAGTEIDHTGFIAVIANEVLNMHGNGWTHYQAIGY